MKIRFDDVEYQLVNDGAYNVETTHFQATIIKEGTLDSIVENVTGVEEIEIVNDNDEIIAVFTGYTRRLAVVLYEDAEEVSVELLNTDIEGQIRNITDSISEIQEVQATQESAISDLGEMTDALSEANDTQDLAIEDLAEVVDSLTPEEE